MRLLPVSILHMGCFHACIMLYITGALCCACQGEEGLTGCQMFHLCCLLQICLPVFSLQPWSFLFSKAWHGCHVFSHNTERKALEITAHPKCSLQCLTDQLKGTATNVRFKPYTVHLGAERSPPTLLSCSFFLKHPVCANGLCCCFLQSALIS